MANFIVDDIKNIFKGKDLILSQIIVLNVAVFIVFNIIENFYPIKFWFMLPGSLLGFITKPHTIVTYMFLHAGFFHILFNMLWLYYMGQILIEYLGTKKFSAAFFLGGISGGLAFVLFSNILNGINGSGSLGLVGASGAVMAVVFAVATLLPEFSIRLFLIGNVKMKYLAAGALILTSVLDFSVNTGGKIAHFGGALFGFIYIKYLQKGQDLGEPFYKVVNFIKYLFASKPKKMKVTHKTAKPKPNAPQPKAKQEVVDRILDKISKSGYDSLTKEEKEILFNMSKEN